MTCEDRGTSIARPYTDPNHGRLHRIGLLQPYSLKAILACRCRHSQGGLWEVHRPTVFSYGTQDKCSHKTCNMFQIN